MEPIHDTVLRARLLDRRQRLATVIAGASETAHLVGLLQEVDAALERMEQGSYGLCEVCHDPIEADLLLADPLVRTCLADFTPAQRRALEQDLHLAARIQGELLPEQNLSAGGWEVYYHYEAAGPVSGDYCDLMPSERGDLFFLLGDVSGKGVAASMLMAHLHAIFRSLVAVGVPVHQLVERANRIFCESTMSAHYATLVCGRAGAAGALELCNAGHCPPLWIRRHEIVSVEATGLPVGLFGSGPYTMKKISLAVGDSLLLYTDGLSEAWDPTQWEYGTERLARLAGPLHALAPKELIQACLEDLKAFQAGAPKRDDLTLMAIRRVE